MRPRRLVVRLVSAQRALLAGLAVLVLLGVAVAVAAPRALGSAADAAVRSGVAQSGVAERTVKVEWVPPYRYFRDEPVDAAMLTATGDFLQQSMRPSLADMVEPFAWAAQSSPYEIRLADTGDRPDPESHQLVALRAQQDGLQGVTWVQGREPRADAPDTVVDGEPAPVFEIALAAQVADGLTVRVGDRLVTGGSSVEGPFVMEVVGTFVPGDSVVWETEPLTVRPLVDATGDVVVITGAGVVAPDDVGRLDGTVADSLSRIWTAPLRPELLDTDRVGTVLDDVGALRTATGGGGYGEGAYVATTRLGDVVTRLQERTHAVTQVWLIAAGALVAVGAAALWFASDLLRRRQRGTFALVRARGARPATVGGVVWSEVALVVVPTAVLGGALAWLAVPSRAVTGPVLAAVAVVALGVLLPGAMAWAAHRDRRREDRGRVRWRVVAEVLLVLAALGSWWLVRDAGGARPALSALLPTLLALVAGVVLLHLLAVARRVARRATAGRRGVVATVALAQDEGSGPRPVVVVLVAAVATTALASCVLASVAAAQERAAYESVGAQARVESRVPALGDALAARADSCGTAPAQARFDALLTDESGRRPATVLLLDLPAYRAAVDGTPLDVSAIAALSEAEPAGGARPVLVPAGMAAPATVQLGEQVVPVRAVGVTPPWLRTGAVVPLVAAIDGWPAPVTPDRWYLCGGIDESAVDGLDPSAIVASVSHELSEMRDQPLVPVATVGVVLAAALALLLALACLLMAEAARRPERLRDATLLRTLGSSARERRAVALLAGLPAVLAAVTVGLLAGVGLSVLVLRGAGLPALSGGTDPTLVVPWGVLSVVALLAAGLTVAAVVLGTARDERAVLAAQLKGDDRT